MSRSHRNEHLLLGLLIEGEGGGAQVLQAAGMTLDAARAEVEKITGRGEGTPRAHIPFAPGAKKVLELALRESLRLKHNYVGTEHVLLGLLRESEGVAAQVIVAAGAHLSDLRNNVLTLLDQ